MSPVPLSPPPTETGRRQSPRQDFTIRYGFDRTARCCLGTDELDQKWQLAGLSLYFPPGHRVQREINRSTGQPARYLTEQHQICRAGEHKASWTPLFIHAALQGKQQFRAALTASCGSVRSLRSGASGKASVPGSAEPRQEWRPRPAASRDWPRRRPVWRSHLITVAEGQQMGNAGGGTLGRREQADTGFHQAFGDVFLGF